MEQLKGAQYNKDRKYWYTFKLVAMVTGGHNGIQTGKQSDRKKDLILGVSLTLKMIITQHTSMIRISVWYQIFFL